MTTVSESIPAALLPEVEAALAWFNREQDASFEVTGILDPDASLAATGTRALRLVLCGGDRCEQRSFRVTPGTHGFDVRLLEDDSTPQAGAATPQAELDPPPGALRGWLDRALERNRFVVLVFYRGFW